MAGCAFRGDALQALFGLDDLAANGCAIGGFHRFGVAGERLLDFREVLFGRAGGFVVEQAHAGFEERRVAVGTRELAAAFLDHAPVKIALLNNSVYGMVRQWQTLFYNHHYSATNLLDGENTSDIVDVPDFVKLAEAYGCVGMRAFTKDEAIECIKKANEINDRPVLIDFRVWKDAMVWPMVAAGDSNDNVTYKPGVKPLQRAGEND